MADTSDLSDSPPASPDQPTEAQFGPHRFYAGEGGGSEQFRGARFDVADLRGARFTDCDLTGVRIRDGWLVDLSVSGRLNNFTVNGVDVTGFVNSELDRRHPERVQLREAQSAEDLRAMWDTIERLWTGAADRAGRLPVAALAEEVDEEWSFVQTLRHLIFITDAWASRTVLDEPMPYHPIGLPQSWYPAREATALGIDAAAQPDYADILAVRADRMAVVRSIVDGLTDDDLGRRCHRSPAPGYLDEELMVAECIGVVMEEEIEHHRFAVRDLAVLEANYTPDRKGAQSLPDVDLGNVIELEIALLSDEVRRSRALLEELLDPEFCEIGASGRMRTRPEVLDEILADQPGVRSPIQTAEMEASAVGEDLILVRYVSDSNGRRARRSSLWRRAGGSWRVVFHQGTLL